MRKKNEENKFSFKTAKAIQQIGNRKRSETNINIFKKQRKIDFARLRLRLFACGVYEVIVVYSEDVELENKKRARESNKAEKIHRYN